MAKTTIHSTSWQVKIDTREFEQGSTATRKQIGLMKKAAKDVLTPLEKYEMEMAELGNLLEKDARFQEVYNRKAAQLKKELDAATKSVDKFTDEMDEGRATNKAWIKDFADLGGVMTIARGGLDLITTSARRAMEGFTFLRNTVEELDKRLLSMADRDIPAKYLGAMKVLAADSKIEVEKLDTTFQKLSIKIGEANTKGGAIADTFARMGFNFQAAAGKDAWEQMEDFSQSLRGVATHSERAAIANEALGRGGIEVMTQLLNASGSLEEIYQRSEKLGYGMTDEAVERISKAAASSQRLELAWEGFNQQLAITASGPLEGILDALGVLLGQQPTTEPGAATAQARDVVFQGNRTMLETAFRAFMPVPLSTPRLSQMAAREENNRETIANEQLNELRRITQNLQNMSQDRIIAQPLGVGN